MEGTHRNQVSQMLLAREGASTNLPCFTRGTEMDRGNALGTAGKAGTVSTGSIMAASHELICLLHSFGVAITHELTCLLYSVVLANIASSR